MVLLDDRCTFDVLHGVEALGLCAAGRAAESVRHAVRTGPSGHGGQLAGGHAGGYGQLFEAVLQLRGDAGARQIPNARVAVVSSSDPTGSAAAIVMGAERAEGGSVR
ncbi:hypothetical protein AB0F17_02120 [Nonomuraea sp. NPDC026600]|uniref:thiolase C-terminal domain-containing protein n=1 Tax=Nonomuraea sp. NPDC026600 TaxID=3155363 RepID=UPI0033E84806